ncbi:MAG: 4Fe-4S dicluster domain-containing protein, partial [bacterium]
MSKSIIAYTMDSCVRCMRCIKACPTSALSRNRNRITIDEKRCINCGRCIQVCHHRG